MALHGRFQWPDDRMEEERGVEETGANAHLRSLGTDLRKDQAQLASSAVSGYVAIANLQCPIDSILHFGYVGHMSAIQQCTKLPRPFLSCSPTSGYQMKQIRHLSVGLCRS